MKNIDDTGMTVIVIFVVVLLTHLLFPIAAVAAPYDDCILQNMKGVMAQNAANAIARACREKTTPKKCRPGAIETMRQGFVDLGTGKTPPAGSDFTSFDAYLRGICLKECADANYYSRTFGDCSTD